MGKSSQRSMEARMMRMTQQQLAEEREERRIQREILEKQKAEYKAFQFVNPYADVENQFEDMGVATEAAELQLERGTQQRANILESLRGAAGSSGGKSLWRRAFIDFSSKPSIIASCASLSVIWPERCLLMRTLVRTSTSDASSGTVISPRPSTFIAYGMRFIPS